LLVVVVTFGVFANGLIIFLSTKIIVTEFSNVVTGVHITEEASLIDDHNTNRIVVDFTKDNFFFLFFLLTVVAVVFCQCFCSCSCSCPCVFVYVVAIVNAAVVDVVFC
jgi:hypothetical protein